MKNGYIKFSRKHKTIYKQMTEYPMGKNDDGPDGLQIRVNRGTFVYSNTATQANKVTTAHILKPCYIEDDQTVTALATGSSIAGTVIRVDGNGIAVEIGYTAPATGA